MTKCRIYKKEVKKILYFGKLALAGNFLKKNQIPKEKKYDLTSLDFQRIEGYMLSKKV